MQRSFQITTALLLLLFFSVLPCQAEFSKTKLAVFDFDVQGHELEHDDLGGMVAEWFITAMVKEGRFDVIERAHLQKIIAEQKLGMSGLFEESSVAEVGKVLGVKTIISGSVMIMADSLEVTARIIDVESASILAAEQLRSPSTSELSPMIGEMAKLISKNYPLQGYVVERSGNRVSIDLGAGSGIRLGMEFIAYKEGKIIRHPKTGQVIDIKQEETGLLVITEVGSKMAQATIISEVAPQALRYGQLVKNVQPGLKSKGSYKRLRHKQAQHKPIHHSVGSGEAPLTW